MEIVSTMGTGSLGRGMNLGPLVSDLQSLYRIRTGTIPGTHLSASLFRGHLAGFRKREDHRWWNNRQESGPWCGEPPTRAVEYHRARLKTLVPKREFQSALREQRLPPPQHQRLLSR